MIGAKTFGVFFRIAAAENETSTVCGEFFVFEGGEKAYLHTTFSQRIEQILVVKLKRGIAGNGEAHCAGGDGLDRG
jgi:hypothetical protein